MKYIVNHDDLKSMQNDVEEYENKQEAIDAAEYMWNHLTNEEQKHIEVYVIESVNPDEDAPNHYDGNYIVHFRKEG